MRLDKTDLVVFRMVALARLSLKDGARPGIAARFGNVTDVAMALEWR